MDSNATLYDKTGAAYSLDHEIGGTAYVRPMVKVVIQSAHSHGDDFEEFEGFEPASYLVAIDRAALFDAPPISQVNSEVSAARAALDAIKAETAREVRLLRTERATAEAELAAAKRKLNDWKDEHRVMLDLGKLLDGQVLYPLSIRENHYHKAREISRIPEMRNVAYLAVTSGNFETGQKWACKKYASDNYGSNFRFFDTEAERSAVIAAEFSSACDSFRKAPNLDTTTYTSGTTLHYGTLMEWVKVHPALSIPDDIKAMKAEHDAKAIEAKRAKLAAELANLDSTQ